MNPDPSKLRHQQTEEQIVSLCQTQQQAAVAFSSAEELIRHDARQTQAPAAIAERLQVSISREPKPRRPWWRRLFSRA